MKPRPSLDMITSATEEPGSYRSTWMSIWSPNGATSEGRHLTSPNEDVTRATNGLWITEMHSPMRSYIAWVFYALFCLFLRLYHFSMMAFQSIIFSPLSVMASIVSDYNSQRFFFFFFFLTVWVLVNPYGSHATKLDLMTTSSVWDWLPRCQMINQSLFWEGSTTTLPALVFLHMRFSTNARAGRAVSSYIPSLGRM